MKYLDSDISAEPLQSIYHHFAVQSDVYAAIMAEAAGDAVCTNANDSITGTESNEFIFGGAGYDVLTGGYGNDVLSGGAGNDTLYGVEGVNVLLGMDGDDIINGGAGDDVINGGTGNDVMSGDAGNDTYYFDAGCGVDRITDISGNNRIMIGKGLRYDDMSVSYENDALVLRFAGSSDQLVIEGFTRHEIFRNFTITFESDNTELDCSDVTQAIFNTVNGTENADSLWSLFGTSANLRGYGGDDTLSGSEDNDILDGGTGADGLNGGNGTDTYIFAKGYGNDTVNEWGSDVSIIKLTDINSDEVTLNSQSENNLVISVNGTSDTLTISNYRWSQGSFTLEFADGAVAVVNKETWEMEYSQYPTVATEETAVTETESSVSETAALETVVTEASDEGVVQSNAETLTAIYMMDSPLASTFADETDNTIISDVTESTTIANETDEVADQTDLQVMILTENMSAFADENNVSDGINVADTSADVTVMSQLLVNSAV